MFYFCFKAKGWKFCEYWTVLEDQTISNLQFGPLLKNSFPSIQIDLRDTSGEKIPFVSVIFSIKKGLQAQSIPNKSPKQTSRSPLDNFTQLLLLILSNFRYQRFLAVPGNLGEVPVVDNFLSLHEQEVCPTTSNLIKTAQSLIFKQIGTTKWTSDT